MSLASSGSQSRPQITLITFQPAPRNCASSSWMIFPLPRTGPSRRCRLQLITKVRLSSSSRAARPIEPSTSGSSLSPSPRNAQTCDRLVSLSSRASRYRLNRAWYTALIAPRPMDTVGNSQKSGISRGCG